MPPNTRARTGTSGRPSDGDPPQEHRQRQKAGGVGRARQGNGTREQYTQSQITIIYCQFLTTCCLGPTSGERDRNSFSAPITNRCVLSIATQRLTLSPCLAGSHPTQTSPSSSPKLQQNGGQPSPSMNPIQNTRMGEPFHLQPPPPSTSLRPPNTSFDQAGPSFTPSHSSPQPHLLPPSSQPIGPTSTRVSQNQSKMRRKPRGITVKGLKQSMGLHNDQVSRNAYNRFRVRDLSY